MKTVQFIIDPQKDFIISPDYTGSLGVPGAYEDMLRLGEHINKTNPDAIVITLDTHEKLDIAHALWWIDSEGNHPSGFTQILPEDIISGKWRTSDPLEQDYSLFYTKELEKNNKNSLMVWPDHCINGSEGHNVNNELKEVLESWEKANAKKVIYVKKGTNPRTEHYSGLKAEVVLPGAEETQLNTKLINELNTYDKIEVSGEAVSHCVGGTLMDLLENLPVEDRQKVNILSNCTSPVVGYELQGNTYLQKAQELGAKLSTVGIVKKLSI